MPLQIAALNSGSNGNCYYVGDEHSAILIDAGLSLKETEKRLRALQLDPNKIKALFISHEHHDHITGLPALCRQWAIPVYLTPGTQQHLPFQVSPEAAQPLKALVPVNIDNLQVVAFEKHHDAAEPVSFVISNGAVNVGVFTDIGHCCPETQRFFKICHAVFLESNYCEKMLADGMYPEPLKKRIRGKKGHLSNDQSLEIFMRYRNKDLQHLILSHLSQNNNTQEIVRQTFTPHAGNTAIIVASRYRATEVITLSELPQGNSWSLSQLLQEPTRQLSLF